MRVSVPLLGEKLIEINNGFLAQTVMLLKQHKTFGAIDYASIFMSLFHRSQPCHFCYRISRKKKDKSEKCTKPLFY